MMSDEKQLNMRSTYARLGADASVELLPVGKDFWQRLGSGQLGSFHNEFLVSVLSIDSDWTSWEMHPHGEELVLLLSGAVSFVMECDGQQRTTELREPEAYVLVEKGTWHTMKVHQPSRVLFITAGEATRHRDCTTRDNS